MDKNMIAMCGAYCGECSWKEQTGCPGCQAAKGTMFWGECKVARCSLENGFNHCGLCSKLPCSQLQSSFDNPEHGDNGERLANLKGWAAGKESYVSLSKKK